MNNYTTNGPTALSLSMAYKRIAQLEAELAAAGVALLEQYDIAADAIARLNDSTRKASDLADEQAVSASLRAELNALRGAQQADQYRTAQAAERVGLAPMGCDTLDWMADEIEWLTAERDAALSDLSDAKHDILFHRGRELDDAAAAEAPERR